MSWRGLVLLLAIQVAVSALIVVAVSGLEPAAPGLLGAADPGPVPCEWLERRAGLCVELTTVAP